MRGSLLFAVASVAAFGAIAHRRDARPRSEPAASRTRIVLLGTGTPNADPDRAGPALAIVVDSNVYLVDAGAGIVRRAAAAARDDSIPALGAAHLRIDFLTHLHSDHTVGLPDLMFSPWVLGRTAPLDVYGPPGTASMIDHLDAAYAEDVDIRLHGGEPSNKTGYGGRAHEVAPGIVYRDALVRVTAFAVQHGAWPHAYGYRFDTPDRSIVISGDTRPSEAVVRACDGCDVLVHEVYLSSALDTRSTDWQAYHHAYHTTSLELGGIAARARPKLLVLYHLLPPGVSDSALIADVRQTFSGAVRVGRDLGVY
jgi:ribonuclease Z